MKELTDEQIESLNDFIAKKIEESKFKNKERDKKIILSVGTETLELLKEMFSKK